MTTTVLAYFPSPAQGVWYLGPFPIRAYALCIIAGIIVALVVGDRRWAARGGERGVIYDIALWAVPFGLIGGRVYHVMTDWRTYFGPDGAGAGAALRIWEGGLGIWGAVALGGVGAWIACRRRGIPLPAFGDAIAPGIVLAQAIGRLGNYFNQELYGRETTVPWGMEIFYRRDWSGVLDVHSLDGVSTGEVAAVVHPTFLYELLWNVLVFIVLIWADRRFRLGHGRLFALYVAGYSLGRFWIELMRDDTATLIAGIRINVFTATFVFIGAVVYMLLAPKGREDPETLRGKQSAEEAEDESAVEEWAEDLVAAATGSGIVAAAAVAGEHDSEDAEAAGDVEEVEEYVAEDIPEVVEAAAAGVAEDLEVEAVALTETETDLLSEQEQEQEAVEDLALAAQAEVDQEAEVAADADDGPVVVYEAAPEAETVVASENGADELEAEVEAEAEAELDGDEPEVEAESESEVEPEADVEPEPDVEPEAEPEPEVAVKPEPEPEAEAELQPEPPAPKFGPTLKRLLWGVGNQR